MSEQGIERIEVVTGDLEPSMSNQVARKVRFETSAGMEQYATSAAVGAVSDAVDAVGARVPVAPETAGSYVHQATVDAEGAAAYAWAAPAAPVRGVPDAPTEAGTYSLQATVDAEGVAVYAWASVTPAG